jgi:uncharacterized protein YqeY
MALKERISEELKAAMKSGDRIRLETLRTLRATLMEKEIEKRVSGQPVSADDEIAALNSASKKRKEAIEHYRLAGRNELAEQEEKELAIIKEYLPKELGEAEILAVIREAISSTGAGGAADFGKVMPLVMKLVKGKADGKLVQELLKKTLGGDK